MDRKPRKLRVPKYLIKQINSLNTLFEDHVEDLKTFVEANANRVKGAEMIPVQVLHYAVLKLGYNAELFEQQPWGMEPSKEPCPNENTHLVPDFGNDCPEIAKFRIRSIICGLLGLIRDDLSSGKESLEDIYLDSYIQGRETRERVLERMCAETLESDSEDVDITLLIHAYCMQDGYDIAPFPNRTVFVKDLFKGQTQRELGDFGADRCFRAWASGFLELPSQADDILGKFGYTPSQEYAESYEKGVKFRERILEEN